MDAPTTVLPVRPSNNGLSAVSRRRRDAYQLAAIQVNTVKFSVSSHANRFARLRDSADGEQKFRGQNAREIQ